MMKVKDSSAAPAYSTAVQHPPLPEYLPESDGKPMAETDTHRDQMIALLDALAEHFRDDPRVYVSGNVFLYYLDETGERQSVSPDIMVVRGIEKKLRRYYKLEAEGKAPDLVIELMSTSTKVEDLGNKRVIYASMGVREYFLFDPTGEALNGQLRGFRLENGDFMPMMGARLHSEVLGLDLILENGRLRLQNSKTGERLRTHQEAEADRRAAEAKASRELKARQAAETNAQKELAARQAAEAKNVVLQDELAHLREELARLQKTKA